MESLSWMWPLALALFGLVFGSFANVVIWRVPRGESVVSPGSHCPSCGHAVRWYDNIPVVSWLVLRARCRDCGGPISARYPVVELLSGVLWLAAGLRFGLSVTAVTCVAFFYLLLILSLIDLDTYRLPNVLVGTLAVIGLAGAALSQVTGVQVAPLLTAAMSGPLAQPLLAGIAGSVAGAGFSGVTAAVYGRLRGRSGLGMGDVKLLGAMGLYLGPYVLLALFVGSLVGAVAGLVGVVRSGESATTHRVPFGPYLALGGVVSALAGPAVWGWYLSLLGAG